MVPLTREEFLDDLAQVHAICAYSKNFVPVVCRGLLIACNQRNLPEIPAGLPVEDFVLGMEALRLPFLLLKQFRGEFYLSVPIDMGDVPKAWSRRALALREAFTREREVEVEVAKYLLEAGRVFSAISNPICQSLLSGEGAGNAPS